jgi:subfamily B ATP-binding cassette protein MsbA
MSEAVVARTGADSGSGWKLIGRFLPLIRPDRWRLAVAGSLMALEVPLSIAVPLIARELFDQALPADDFGLAVDLCLLILGVSLVSRILGFLQGFLLMRFRLRFNRRLRLKLFRHFQSLDLAYFLDKDTGYLLSRQVDDVGDLEGVLADTFLSAVVESLRAVFFVVVLFVLEPYLAGSGMLFVAGVVAFNLLSSRPLRRAAGETRETWSLSSTTLYEALSGHFLIRACAAEPHVRALFTSRLVRHLRARYRRDLLVIALSRLGGLVDALGLSLTLLVGIWRILGGHFTVGGMFAFYMILVNLFGVTRALASLNPTLQRSLASAARIGEILDTRPVVRDRPDARPLAIRRGQVAFREVEFSYRPGRPVLQEIELDARPGETVALVGPSGAGKTTLVSLIPRFFDVERGAVEIDGVDVRQYSLRSLRRQVATVPQDVFLLNRSVRDNLVFGLSGGDPRIAQDRIEEAARAANAHQFIRRLPQGYDTLIGERGIKLSGGEKQRLAIARELLRDPRILILDEATSNLDSESERLIQEALERLRRSRTTFIIAHRLSTVLAADHILVLDGGKIVAVGDHASLLDGSPLYRRLYETQLLPYSEPAADEVPLAADGSGP